MHASQALIHYFDRKADYLIFFIVLDAPDTESVLYNVPLSLDRSKSILSQFCV